LDSYKIHRTLMDVSITSMTAGQLIELTPDMEFNGTSYRTNRPGVPTTTNISGEYAGEIDSIEVIPAIGTNGQPVFGGTNMWFVIDGENQRHYVDIPVDGAILSWPLHTRVWGGSHLAHLLGVPFWKLALRGLAGFKLPHMPLDNTTIKYKEKFGISIYSINGWTAASGYGLRIIIKGYIYTSQDLAHLAPGWQTEVSYQTEVRDVQGQPALDTATTLAADAISLDTWNQMVGGVQQPLPKVNPYIHYAVTAQATDANTRFALSNDNTTYGGSNHVQNEYQDLGINAVSAQVALLVKNAGPSTITRPSNIGRWGFIVDGTEIPENPETSTAGLVVSDNVNDYFTGDIGPYIGDMGTGTGYAQLYRPTPRLDGQPLLIYHKQKMAPFVAANGTPIPAGAIAFFMEGALVEGVA
jgi:hypothetical protein